MTTKATDPDTFNRLDLGVIVLALETHERVAIERNGPDSPPAIAARRTLAKARRILDANRGRR